MFFVIAFFNFCLLSSDSIQAPGTKLFLNIPSDFIVDSKLPGFKSTIDGSEIIIYEIDNQYTYAELIESRLKHTLELGIDTCQYRHTMYNGYNSFQCYLENKSLGFKSFNLEFGNDDFFVMISLQCPKSRLEKLKKVLLCGKYDKSIRIDKARLLGFAVDFNETSFVIRKEDANSFYLIQKKSNGEIISYVNFCKLAKDIFKTFKGK